MTHYKGSAILSNTSKMPGKSFGIGAHRCITGSKLVKIKGSTCSDCYALKGSYTWDSYQNAEPKRWELINSEKFVEIMTASLSRLKGDVFRWFDSGDVQSVKMAVSILNICEATPKLKHWIPSREAMIWKNALKIKALPDNVTLRISATMIDGKPPSSHANTSTVHKDKPAIGYACPASNQGGKCLECRACWSRDIKNVSYKAH